MLELLDQLKFVNIIYDIEVFPNLFTVTFKDADTKEEWSFVVHKSRNDLRSLLSFLSKLAKNKANLIGFNNIGYDYPVIEPLLSNWKHIWNRYKDNPEGFTKFIYNRSVAIISSTKEEWYKNYSYRNYIIQQVDLFKIYHLDNKNKRGTSLKWVEFAIGHDLLQTFDFDPHSSCDDIEEVLAYNLNDVRATEALYLKSVDKIEYRLSFGKLEGLDLLNCSDTTISKKLFSKYLCESMGIEYWDLKNLRTIEHTIDFNEVIFDYIEFESPLLKAFLNNLKSQVVTIDRESEDKEKESLFKEKVEYANLHFDFGIGGLHAYPRKWHYSKKGERLKKKPSAIPQSDVSNDTHQIILVDVSSYYPNLAIKNDLKPKHLGESFTGIYEDFYNRRAKAKYSGDKLVDLAMKLSLNSVFGLSNEQHSFFYDVRYLLTTTINGQLLLTMLAEKFHLEGIKLLQCNTDGIYIYVDKTKIPKVESICDDWCTMTSLKLDLEYFDKLYQRDVNSYIGVMSSGKVYKKGAFRTEKDIHEDSSMKIVPMALEQHFLYNVDYREYIKGVKDINPFMLGIRLKNKLDTLEERYLDDTKTKIEIDGHKKAVRYYVSKSGNGFYKVMGRSGDVTRIHDGFKCKNANDLSTVVREDIDESFYIQEVEKITSLFHTQQYKLF